MGVAYLGLPQIENGATCEIRNATKRKACSSCPFGTRQLWLTLGQLYSLWTMMTIANCVPKGFRRQLLADLGL